MSAAQPSGRGAPTVTVYVDGRAQQVRAGQNFLQVCLDLKLDLPYFCWHPALGSVGACRQCAVKQFKDEHDTRGRIVMACLTPAMEGARIAIQDPEAQAFRASVIEWLMLNHPHDCPVCDEGGECHLQDMTVMTGHTLRRDRFAKRTYRNQDLGPLVYHEMNRCIQCYRCVRYYRDYAGGRDLDVFGAHDHVYFGRQEDGVLESPFSGNLVEVCPTGVFTDKTLRQHYTRKWDLQNAPSICVHCSVGCNTIAGERYGELRRIVNRYHGEVNRYFLCDRGRYGYAFVNGDRRVRQTRLRPDSGGPALPATRDAALRRLAPLVGAGRVLGIGSPRASLESNFALRTLVGPERFCLGLASGESRLLTAILAILQKGPAGVPSLHEVEQSDAVLVLGEDPTNTAPVLGLALRQSVRQQPLQIADRLKIPRWQDASVRDALRDAKGPLFIATPAVTSLDDVATACVRAAPDDIARLGQAVAHELDPAAPHVEGLPEASAAMAHEIGTALVTAARPLIVSGTGAGSLAVIQAAANVAWALIGQGRPAQLAFAVSECNSLGLALLGGIDLDAAFRIPDAETVLVLENDLYRRAPESAVEEFLSRVRPLIVLDAIRTPTADRAEAVLPAATFAEGDGTLVSAEGRAQRFYQALLGEKEIQESWRWVRDLLLASGRREAAGWSSLDALARELADAVPALSAIRELSPPPELRGQNPLEAIPRQSHRYSGRTAMLADRTVHEPKPPRDPDSPLVFSMEGRPGPVPGEFIPLIWAPGWNSVQAVTKLQAEVNGPLGGGDPGRRLLEPARDARPAYFSYLPAAFRPRSGHLYVVGLSHVFGSEELSSLSAPLATLIPLPYLALSEDDLLALGLAAGETAWLELDGVRLALPLTSGRGLPPGLAGLPAGLPGLPMVSLPAWGTVRRAG